MKWQKWKSKIKTPKWNNLQMIEMKKNGKMKKFVFIRKSFTIFRVGRCCRNFFQRRPCLNLCFWKNHQHRMLVLTFYFYGQMGNSISSKKVNVSLKTLLFSSFFVAYSIEVMRACLADSTFLDLTIASRYGCRQSSRPHRCLPQRIASNESVVGRLGRNNAALYCSLKKMTRPIAVVIPRRRSRCSPFHCPFR